MRFLPFVCQVPNSAKIELIGADGELALHRIMTLDESQPRIPEVAGDHMQDLKIFNFDGAHLFATTCTCALKP